MTVIMEGSIDNKEESIIDNKEESTKVVQSQKMNMHLETKRKSFH